MHIVALNHVYWPNSAATAQLLTELLEGLARRGHAVTVVARAERDAHGAWLGASERAGVRIERVRDTGLGKGSLWRRAADYASFYAGAAVALGRQPQRPDVLMALTTPPLIAVPAQLVGRLRGAPVVSVVQDLYPDVAVALGAIPANGAVHKLFSQATKTSLCASNAIVVLSDAMRQRVLAYGPPPERVVTIPNWALAELEDAPEGRELGHEARLAYGLGDRFVVMYSGNMGAGHTFETLLKAAERLKNRPDIAFAFVGDGLRRPEVEGFISTHQLDNARLLPLAPRAFLAESLAAADLHVVTMRDDMAGLIVPSKLYGIYAAERPVLFIGPRDADVATSVASAAAGAAFDNGDVDGVVRFITEQAALADRGREAGRRGRAFLRREHGREQAIDAYERVLVAARAGGLPMPSPAVATPAAASHGGRA